MNSDLYESQIAAALNVPAERIGIFSSYTDGRSCAGRQEWEAWLLDESGMRCLFLAKHANGRHAVAAEAVRNATRFREQIRQQQEKVVMQ